MADTIDTTISTAPTEELPQDAGPSKPTEDDKEQANGIAEHETKDDPELGDKATNADEASKDAQDDAETSAVAVDAPAASPGDAPASSKKAKRKSNAGVPEHKTKKLNKKKSQALTHLNAEPGEYYYARLRGHPPWPSVICDESMLPQSLLDTRPVTAKRADGTYREDFADGGKRVTERTFAVMFLETNEFGWIPNTDLGDLDLDTIGEQPEKGKSKKLYRAYQVAAEKHDLDYWKGILKDHQEAVQADVKARSSKKNKRKSKGAVEEDEDVEMEDAGEEMDFDENDEEPKSKSKKRKKDVDSDGEGDKPAKTPKRTPSSKKEKGTPKLKLSNPKTPNGPEETETKGSTAKSGKKKGSSKKAAKAETSDDDDSAKAVEKTLSVEEQREQKQKQILFFRHKLQKGFLTRDQPPKEEEMKSMSDYIAKLETYADLEVSIMRATKINKVLKAIMKLSSIPRDAEFKFKQRSNDLLQAWNRLLANDLEGAGANGAEADAAGTNGVNKEEKSDGEKESEKEAEAKAEVPAEKVTAPTESTAQAEETREELAVVEGKGPSVAETAKELEKDEPEVAKVVEEVEQETTTA
ncbi:MAG: hypothetical protein M1817_004975 [Caeruleum heppii]|nr:MAG: hypothetical protein M1817_004975 [Caeruleum heppii]